MPQRGEIVVDDLLAKVHQAATSPLNTRREPTDGQKRAGNYKVGRVRIGGMAVSVENPQGSIRSGTDADGKPWETAMTAHYGYLPGTRAADSTKKKTQGLDVFIKPGTSPTFDGQVYVVDQMNEKTGKLDEHKVVLGASSEEDARRVYLSNYSEGWNGLGAITPMPVAAFKAWAYDGKRKTKPLGDISGWRPAAAADAGAAPPAAPLPDAGAAPAAAGAPAAGAAAPAAVLMRVGKTPADAQPVSVRDGFIHIGDEPAIGYDSGEPIPAPTGGTDADLRQALTAAGALSRSQKFFGGTKAVAAAPAAQQNDATEPVAGAAAAMQPGTPASPAEGESKAAALESPPERGVMAQPAQQAQAAAPAGSPFRAFLREVGVSPKLLQTFTGERSIFKGHSRFPKTFRPKGLELDELVQRAAERGFLVSNAH